jgi:hypothetical protein
MSLKPVSGPEQISVLVVKEVLYFIEGGQIRELDIEKGVRFSAVVAIELLSLDDFGVENRARSELLMKMGDKGCFIERGGDHDVEEGFVISDMETSCFTFLGNAEHLDMKSQWVFLITRIVGFT